MDQIPSGLDIHGINPMIQMPKLQSQFQLLRSQHQQGAPNQVLSHIISDSDMDLPKLECLIGLNYGCDFFAGS